MFYMSKKIRPKIIVVVGAPASGKTKIGREIARTCNLAVSDKDHVTGQLLAAMMKDAGFEGEDYSQTDLNRFRKAIYGCMEDVAKDNLRVGMGTVIISPYADRGYANWFDDLRSRIDANGEADWFVVWVDITPEFALKRIKKRNSPRDVIKLKDWNAFVRKNYWGAPNCEHIRLNAEDSLDSKVKKVFEYINK